jgi:hypothetical protein
VAHIGCHRDDNGIGCPRWQCGAADGQDDEREHDGADNSAASETSNVHFAVPHSLKTYFEKPVQLLAFNEPSEKPGLRS